MSARLTVTFGAGILERHSTRALTDAITPATQLKVFNLPLMDVRCGRSERLLSDRAHCPRRAESRPVLSAGAVT